MDTMEDQNMVETRNEKKALNHKEALEIIQKSVREILEDPLLSDLPEDATSEEIKAKLDLEQGKAFVVFLKRESEEGEHNIDLIVNDKTTIRELKKHVERKVTRIVQTEGETSCLSWKYFWRTYWLVHNHEKLSDDKKSMKDYNIKDKSILVFLKRLRRE